MWSQLRGVGWRATAEAVRAMMKINTAVKQQVEPQSIDSATDDQECVRAQGCKAGSGGGIAGWYNSKGKE